MRPASLVALCRRRAEIKTSGPLPRYTNIMLRLEQEIGEEEVPELYAKVIRLLDEAGKRYLIHFTSVPPRIREQLRQIEKGAGSP